MKSTPARSEELGGADSMAERAKEREQMKSTPARSEELGGADSMAERAKEREQMKSTPARTVLERGLEVLATEIAGLEEVRARLARDGAAFERACRLLLDCSGKVALVGLGKSGHVGRKIAATLASTGTPAIFVQAAEAAHGDLGMIRPGDVVLALSNSGETEEISTLLPALKELGIAVIALSGGCDSTLARAAEVFIHTGVSLEACPLGLAPTASTTATLAVGDALAVALMRERGLSPGDFARSHPGGLLGRRLSLKIGDIMARGKDVPCISGDKSVAEAIVEMSRKGLGFTAVLEGGELAGVFTDGDLRRSLSQGLDIHTRPVAQEMTREPRTARAHDLAYEALNRMRSQSFNALPVVAGKGRPVGAINIHSLLRAGLA